MSIIYVLHYGDRCSGLTPVNKTAAKQISLVTITPPSPPLPLHSLCSRLFSLVDSLLALLSSSQIAYAGYAALVLSVPASFLTAIVEQPRFRAFLEGDDFGKGAGGSSLGRKIVGEWREWYTKDEKGIVRGFHNEGWKSKEYRRVMGEGRVDEKVRERERERSAATTASYRITLFKTRTFSSSLRSLPHIVHLSSREEPLARRYAPCSPVYYNRTITNHPSGARPRLLLAGG